MSKAINWPDRENKVRYEMAIDVTDRKESEKNRESILHINQILLSELDITRALNRLSQELRNVVQHDLIGIAQINADQDQFKITYAKNDQSELLKDVSSIKKSSGKFSGSLTEKLLKGRKKSKKAKNNS